jgi:glycosyltransferase involved in cell wall biosynthesis
MHILIFLDQSPASLGGAQASVLLQQKYLQRAGHTVTVVAPANKKSTKPGASTPGQILYPSFPLTPDGEYAATAALTRTYNFILKHLKALPPVDVVHAQGDWWGAILAKGFANRQNLPLVHTLHTNLVTGTEAAVGKLGAGILTWLNAEVHGRWVQHKPWQGTIDGWKYLRELTAGAKVVIAPTHHFAKLATEHQVATNIRVVPTGVDNEQLSGIDRNKPTTPITFAWSGRFSHEKRMLEFLKAVALANLPVHIKIFGGGPLLKQAEALIRQTGLADRVHIVGRITHQQMLQELAHAHALVQTSIGFETQGMTVYEAGVVGTPSILCDANIAGELPQDSYWLVPDATVEALARTLTEAHQAIIDGRSKHIDLSQELYQSNLVERSLAIYREAIAAI